MKYLKLIVLLLFAISYNYGYGFTFTAVATPETCPGNGTLTFSVTNPDPAGTLVYVIYKLPETVTPFATVTGNFLSGLSSGTYLIIARETVGNSVTTQQLTVTIGNQVQELVYSIQALNQACSNTSNILVNVTQGNATGYEIFSGPVLFPLQTSNAFNNLPVGVYKVRVYDNCGGAVVQTFTVTENQAGITISPPTFSEPTPVSCALNIIANVLEPFGGTVLGYPLQVTFTVHPPGGGTPEVHTTTILSGNPLLVTVSATVTEYINQNYDYDISVTDGCGVTYSANFPLDNPIVLGNTIVVLDCNQNYFEISAGNYYPPYTLNFTQFPAGFDPSLFNASYPGPYTNPITQFGSDTQPTPLGQYTVSITDACGKTQIRTFSILDNPPIPSAQGTNNGCLANNGNIVVAINGYDITNAVIVSAPATYPFPLPHDVSALIDGNGVLVLNTIPIGLYSIQLIDNCGNNLAPIDGEILPYSDRGLTSEVRTGCSLGTGAVKIDSGNGKITSISITSAPASFTQPLPFNISNQIVTIGSVFLDNLPQGTYVFTATDECGFTNTISVDVPGYAINSVSFSLTPNCGSFNIPLDFDSNGTTEEKYFLQKLLDTTTDTWGHPLTNVVYTEGTIPDITNGLALINQATNFNLTFNGTFRIVRTFLTYNNGQAIMAGSFSGKTCIEKLEPLLTFNESLEILEANRMPCSPTGDFGVIINAVGFAPLHYSITLKDGLPFPLDNGNSNIFYGLTPGTYTFLVEDFCGNQATRVVDVSALVSLVTITDPQDVLQCKATISGNETFDLTALSSTILGNQSPSEYTLTYHTSLPDAQNGANPIINLTQFNPSVNPQTIYARLIFNALPGCYEIVDFELIVGQTPFLNLQANYLNCTNAPVVLDASVGNIPQTTYVWSNGATTPTVEVSQAGITQLSVTATNTYGSANDLFCSATTEVTVTISSLPEITGFEIVDWTADENSITVLTTNTGAYEYSLDGVVFQESNVFQGLLPGLYTVFVRDLNGCGISTKEVWLLYYPKFFTPNGDGYHERWQIPYAAYEPGLQVMIYDRFGKAMASFDASSLGWDGTYNACEVPATDYWFVVYRADGRIHRGHFSLKR